MSFLSNEGVKIHYKVVGEGPALILQCGFMDNLEEWFNHDEKSIIIYALLESRENDA